MKATLRPDAKFGAPCIPVHNWQKVPLRAAGAQEGALCPLLRITPAGGCLRMPATANKFVHILWKNLICDNVAAVAFFRLTPGAGVLAM